MGRIATKNLIPRLTFPINSNKVKGRMLTIIIGKGNKTKKAQELFTTHEHKPTNTIINPENNQHPSVQFEIAETITAQANTILVTNSPYITDHINNLIEASKLSPKQQEQIAQTLKLKNPNSIIKPEKITAIHVDENNETTNIMKDDQIDLTTFATESNYITSIYAEIINLKF